MKKKTQRIILRGVGIVIILALIYAIVRALI